MDRQGYSRKLDKSVVGIQLQGRGQVLVHRGKGVAGLVAQQGNQAECHKRTEVEVCSIQERKVEELMAQAQEQVV